MGKRRAKKQNEHEKILKRKKGQIHDADHTIPLKSPKDHQIFTHTTYSKQKKILSVVNHSQSRAKTNAKATRHFLKKQHAEKFCYLFFPILNSILSLQIIVPSDNGATTARRKMTEAPQQPSSHMEQIIDQEKAAAIKNCALRNMSLCDGWCSDQKGAFLIDLVLKTKPQVIVEIGVWGGKSFVPMASALQGLGQGIAYGIDPWDNQASIEAVTEPANLDYWGWVDHKLVKGRLIGKIKQFCLENYIELIQKTSEDTDPISDIDLLHIDGNHSDKTSYFDVTKWVPYVRSGGWIIFDDMTWHESGAFTTARAVEWLNANCIKFAEFTDACTWGVWFKP